MAGWVRAGGGGIPSSLKTDMNAVLNKKFGTSQDYPPTDWPEDVNLLGPLPEKTVSGSIANFSDGADDVPIKSAKFNFLPIQAAGTPSPSTPLAITGWTGLNAYKQKKNLANIFVDGYVPSVTNGALVQSSGARSDFFKVSPDSYYTFSSDDTSQHQQVYFFYYTNNKTYINYVVTNTKTVTYKTPANCAYIMLRFGTNSVTNGMVESGSTATTYEAYQAPTSYPVTWQDSAGTLYGGYVDAVRGKVVKTMKLMTISEMGFVRSVDYFTVNKSALGALGNSSTKLYCSCFPRGASNSDKVFWETSIGIRFRDSDYSTAQEMEQALGNQVFCFELDTPEEYDITAFIPSTYLGSNNFYSDANGNTEVTYRADIELALSALNNNRGLMMMSRPEEQEETEETEPESDER